MGVEGGLSPRQPCRRMIACTLSVPCPLMESSWLTYKQAADKLGVSPQAARQKAIRGRWPRTRGNDGQALIQVPEQPYQLVDALESHIKTLQGDVETLKEQLAAEQAKASAAIAAFASLADRLDALAADRARSWWRRLAG